ncbi:hypothetical protein K402DRAFT_402723 [Aulographum hederae CBS 113979]|uniref:GH16 domain-containing protein n=1 Tax=Aulographum hederae CBS 113979 TaxID=1176131 RepID=A0A6G1H636_9PEZI|nr:hypothetical protein K402DRAFT_402723 [Aulographum hederae CBS 113979]
MLAPKSLLSLPWIALLTLSQHSVARAESCSCGYYDEAADLYFTESLIVYFNESAVPADQFYLESFANNAEKSWNSRYRQGASPENVQQQGVSKNSSLELFVSPPSKEHLVEGAGILTSRKDVQYGSFRTQMRSPQAGLGGSSMSFIIQYNDTQSLTINLQNTDDPTTAWVSTLINDEFPDRKLGTNYTTIENESQEKGSNISPWNFMEVRVDWTPDRVEFFVAGNRTRSILKKDKSLPSTPSTIHFRHWSTGNSYSMAGPPLQQSKAEVGWSRMFFNSSEMSSADHQAYDERCASTVACNIGNMQLRGSTLYSEAATIKWKQEKYNRAQRTPALILSCLSIGIVTLLLIHTAIRRTPWGKIIKPKPKPKARPEIRHFGSSTPDSSRFSPSPAPSYRSTEDWTIAQACASPLDLNCFYPTAYRRDLSRSSSTTFHKNSLSRASSMTNIKSPSNKPSVVFNEKSAKVPTIEQRSTSPRLDDASPGANSTFNWGSTFNSGASTPVTRSEDPDAIQRIPKLNHANSSSTLVSPQYISLDKAFAPPKSQYAVTPKPSNSALSVHAEERPFSGLSMTEQRDFFVAPKTKLQTKVTTQELDFGFNPNSKLSSETDASAENVKGGPKRVNTAASTRPVGPAVNTTDHPVPAKKRVDYLAGLLVICSVLVTFIHFSLTFVPAVVQPGADQHYPSEAWARKVIGGLLLNFVWVGLFFTTSTRFLVSSYLKSGELRDIAGKAVGRTPRLIIPIAAVALIEYFIIDIGCTKWLEYLPSISWSTWPYVNTYPSFGWYINEVIELAYLVPNAAPQIIYHYCTGVLWTIPVQLQGSWLVLLGVVVVREIRTPWKRFGYYFFCVANHWYARSWGSFLWVGLLLADLDYTFMWKQHLYARPWAYYSVVIGLNLMWMLGISPDVAGQSIPWSFAEIENNIHPDTVTGLPLSDTPNAGYPPYYIPRMTGLFFAVGLQALVELSPWIQRVLSSGPLLVLFPHILTIYLIHGLVFWTWGAWLCVLLSSHGFAYWLNLFIVAMTSYAIIGLSLPFLTPIMETLGRHVTGLIWRGATVRSPEKRRTTWPFSPELFLGTKEKEGKEAGDDVEKTGAGKDTRKGSVTNRMHIISPLQKSSRPFPNPYSMQTQAGRPKPDSPESPFVAKGGRNGKLRLLTQR